MYQMKHVFHCECTREDGNVVCLYYHLFKKSSASAQGHSVHPFWWIAYGVQRCVKTHKQHLQQQQPGTPSVPRSPSKSAHVPSHLLRPSSLSSPSSLFRPWLPSRRPIFHLDLLTQHRSGWFGTVHSLEWNRAGLTLVPKDGRQCIIDYVCDPTLELRSIPSPPPRFPVHMHNFCTKRMIFFTFIKESVVNCERFPITLDLAFKFCCLCLHSGEFQSWACQRSAWQTETNREKVQERKKESSVINRCHQSGECPSFGMRQSWREKCIFNLEQ